MMTAPPCSIRREDHNAGAHCPDDRPLPNFGYQAVPPKKRPMYNHPRNVAHRERNKQAGVSEGRRILDPWEEELLESIPADPKKKNKGKKKRPRVNGAEPSEAERPKKRGRPRKHARPEAVAQPAEEQPEEKNVEIDSGDNESDKAYQPIEPHRARGRGRPRARRQPVAQQDEEKQSEGEEDKLDDSDGAAAERRELPQDPSARRRGRPAQAGKKPKKRPTAITKKFDVHVVFGDGDGDLGLWCYVWEKKKIRYLEKMPDSDLWRMTAFLDEDDQAEIRATFRKMEFKVVTEKLNGQIVDKYSIMTSPFPVDQWKTLQSQRDEYVAS